MDKIESLPPIAKEMVFIKAERVMYCPTIICIETVRVTGPKKAGCNAIISAEIPRTGDVPRRRCLPIYAK